jgi:hypothetical protein
MNLWIAAAPVVAFAIGFSVAPAAAGPCADQIAEFEQFLQEHPGAVGTAPQSVGAQLEHQPTPASIERARQNAKAEIAAALAQAKTLDAQGKQDECVDELAKAKLLLNP